MSESNDKIEFISSNTKAAMIISVILIISWIVYISMVYWFCLQEQPFSLTIDKFLLPLWIITTISLIYLVITLLLFKQNIAIFTIAILLLILPIFGYSSLNQKLIQSREKAYLTIFPTVVANSKPLINAIRLYQQKNNGEPPSSIAMLVPNYISSIPHTGIKITPEFSYTKDGQFADSWQLTISCPMRIFVDFSGFLYKYPPVKNNEVFYQIDGWDFIKD